MAADPTLQQAVAAFNGAPSQAPAEQRAALEGAVGAVDSGPLGANAIPSSVPGPDGVAIPFNPLKDTASTALGHACSLSWLICGLAALVAALLAVAALGGKADDTLIAEESLAPAA